MIGVGMTQINKIKAFFGFKKKKKKTFKDKVKSFSEKVKDQKNKERSELSDCILLMRYGIILDRNLLRVEKEYTMGHIKSLAKFKGVKIETLGDLCMRANLQLIGEDFIESLCKIQRTIL